MRKKMSIFRKIGWIAVAVLLIQMGYSLTQKADATAPGWTWTHQFGKENYRLNDIVAFSNGVLLAVGDNSTVQRSTGDGKWSIVPYPGRIDLTVAASSGKLVVVGGAGSLMVTRDGLTWTKAKLKNSFLLEDFVPYWKGKKEGKMKSSMEDMGWGDVTWDGKQFVASGSAGIPGYGSCPVIAVSSDGMVWTLTRLKQFKDSIWGTAPQLLKYKDNWIAINSDSVYVSNDLKNWITHPSNTGVGYTDIATDGKTIVAVGWDGTGHITGGVGGFLYTSTDGVSFHLEKTDLFYNTSLSKISWDGKEFALGGSYGQIFQSVNGKQWVNKTRIPVYRTILQYVQYKGLKADIEKVYKVRDTYISVGNLGTIRTTRSLDEDWQLEAAGGFNDLDNIAYSGDRYVMTGKGTFLVSDNGKDWMPGDAKQINEESALFEMYADKGTFVMHGIQKPEGQNVKNLNYLYKNNTLQTIRWPYSEEIEELRLVNGEIFAYGRTKTASSTDGVTWKSLSGYRVIPVATNGKLWVGYGYREMQMYTSKDGVVWIKPNKIILDGKSAGRNDDETVYTKKAVWTGKKFAAISGFRVIESVDGVAWKTSVNTSVTLTGIAMNKQGAIAVVGLSDGTIYLCEDGKTWRKQPSPTNKQLVDITSDGKQFLAVGSDGVLVVGKKN